MIFCPIIDRTIALLDWCCLIIEIMTTTLHGLPVELLEAILLELAYPELAVVRNVCHSIRTLCDSTVIPGAKRKLVELSHVIRSDSSTAIVRRKLEPFFSPDFNRSEYLARVGTDVPVEFSTWVIETPVKEIIGWHWPGLQGEHSRQRYMELGINFNAAMMFSRHLKSGYTLLPSANVMEVEDPDYSENNLTDTTFYPGSWQCQKPIKETKIRVLQIWADMAGFSPKITVLILSGSDRWDGHVWLTESKSPFRHSPESITSDSGVQLVWQKSLGTWIEYLKSECIELQTRYHSMAAVKTFRPGLSGNMVYEYT